MKAHICIGGPLGGEFATSEDFQGGYPIKDGRRDYTRKIEGMYEHLAGQYAQYNFGYAPYPTSITKNRPSMVWIHKDLLLPSISPSKR